MSRTSNVKGLWRRELLAKVSYLFLAKASWHRFLICILFFAIFYGPMKRIRSSNFVTCCCYCHCFLWIQANDTAWEEDSSRSWRGNRSLAPSHPRNKLQCTSKASEILLCLLGSVENCSNLNLNIFCILSLKKNTEKSFVLDVPHCTSQK